MNKTQLWILVALITAFAAGACRKDVEEVRPYPVSVEELKLFLQQVPDPASTTVFTFNGLDEDKVLETSSGLRLFLTDVDQLFVAANSATPVACSTCSELKIEVTTALDRGDILARGLATVTPQGALLESRGMVRIRVWCNGTALDMLPGRQIKVQLPAINPQDGLMVYRGLQDGADWLGWETAGQEVFKADWPNQNGVILSGYELLISQLGWSSPMRPLGNSGTTFCANLMPSFTGLNTQSYLVFDGPMTVAPLTFDDAAHAFCLESVPAGYPVRVVSVAKLAADYWYGKAGTETGTNSVLPVQPQKEDATEILDFLRGL